MVQTQSTGVGRVLIGSQLSGIHRYELTLDTLSVGVNGLSLAITSETGRYESAPRGSVVVTRFAVGPISGHV